MQAARNKERSGEEEESMREETVEQTEKQKRRNDTQIERARGDTGNKQGWRYTWMDG